MARSGPDHVPFLRRLDGIRPRNVTWRGVVPTVVRTFRSARVPLTQVSLGERTARRRLQITLEFERPGFVPKRDHQVELPGPVPRRMDALAGVVRAQTRRHVVSGSRVVPVATTEAANDVDELLL